MLKRKATDYIKNWLNTKDRKCLVVQGARQTGKTYIIERFAEENFEELVEINFKQMPSAMEIFSGDLTVDNMVMAMRFRFPDKKIIPGKTLIFLDEIQECQEAITSLKFWAIDNRYDVITSGSLLGIDYKRASSYPVGYVDYLRMYGMDFEEFLWGMGISEDMIGKLCGYLHSKTVIPEAIHSQMMNYYRQYVATGGMPEVVQTYAETKDFNRVREIQKNLLNYYQQDFSKHAEISLVPRLNLVWNSIPMQLAKENKKYIYGQVRKGARAKDFELAIQWLLDCGLIHKVQRAGKAALPLKAYLDLDVFKMYLLDVGLLMAMTDINAQVIIDGNRIFTEFKGALTEQYVLQQLVALDCIEPYYYSTANSSGEIDFLLQGRTSIVPLEVKAEENLRAKSLKAFCEKYKPKYAVRTSMSDYRRQEWMTNIPLYNIDRIREYLEK